MERATAIVQCIIQWPVESNIRLGEGRSWRRSWGMRSTAVRAVRAPAQGRMRLRRTKDLGPSGQAEGWSVQPLTLPRV